MKKLYISTVLALILGVALMPASGLAQLVGAGPGGAGQIGAAGPGGPGQAGPAGQAGVGGQAGLAGQPGPGGQLGPGGQTGPAISAQATQTFNALFPVAIDALGNRNGLFENVDFFIIWTP